MILTSKDLGFPYLPGVSSPSEIMSLLKIDYKIFKFFPAVSLGGLKYLRNLSGPFPDVLFCPTGGINEKNYFDWIKEKNVICVAGSWITPRGFSNYNEIKKRFKNLSS